MVEYLKNGAKCFIIAATVCGALPGAADVLNDPTRPPTSVATEAAELETGPVLQAVSMSKTRKVAIISGQEVAIGGKYGDASLIQLSDSEAVLRSPDGTLQTLRMYSRIEKKVIVPAESKPKKKADRKIRPRE